MTKDEAISILVASARSREPKNRTRYDEAVKMAIEALRQPEPRSFSCGQENDTISRRAAIDVEGLDEEIRCEMCKNQMNTDRGCNGNCKYDEKLYEKIIQILDRRIKSLSSAQPDFDITVKIDKAYDDGYEAGYLQGRHDWGDLDERFNQQTKGI